MAHTRILNTYRARTLCLATLLFASAWMPTLAQAHHDMDGETPMTFMRGLGAGLAHPIIGLDHLVVLLLLGALCASIKAPVWPVLSFAATSILGCLMHTSHIAWPLAELSLALSLVVAGPLAWLIARNGSQGTLAVFALFGVLHGYAYGDSMVGAAPSALFGYVLGFVVIQLIAVSATATLSAHLTKQTARFARLGLVHLLSIACVCVGVTALYLVAA